MCRPCHVASTLLSLFVLAFRYDVAHPMKKQSRVEWVKAEFLRAFTILHAASDSCRSSSRRHQLKGKEGEGGSVPSSVVVPDVFCGASASVAVASGQGSEKGKVAGMEVKMDEVLALVCAKAPPPPFLEERIRNQRARAESDACAEGGVLLQQQQQQLHHQQEQQQQPPVVVNWEATEAAPPPPGGGGGGGVLGGHSGMLGGIW